MDHRPAAPLRAWLALVGLMLAGITHAASPVPLIDAPTGLRWSAQEVQAAALPALQAIEDRARREGLMGCTRRCAQIQRVYGRILAAVRAQGGRAAALPWRLVIVRLPGEQALALPEGQILLSEAFVESRRMSDAMLAFVLAHEMAHSVLEHERQTLTYVRALLPRHVPRSVEDMYAEMAFNAGFLRQLTPISRQMELEADELGLLLAASAGYAPPGLLAFMAGEAALDGERTAMFDSHPSASQRLDHLRLRLPLARRVWQASRAAGAD